MVIDYRYRGQVAEYLRRNQYIEDKNKPVCLEVGTISTKDGIWKTVLPYQTTPHKVPQEYQEVRIEGKGLFKKKISETKTRTVVEHKKNPEKHGIAMVADVSDYWGTEFNDTHIEAQYMNNGWRSGQLTIDPELLMPVLTKQPGKNMEAVVELLKLDPRLIAQLDPQYYSLEELETIKQAVIDGTESVLEYQSNLGVVFNKQEEQERAEFLEDLSVYSKEFLESYFKYHSNTKNLKTTLGVE